VLATALVPAAFGSPAYASNTLEPTAFASAAPASPESTSAAFEPAAPLPVALQPTAFVPAAPVSIALEPAPFAPPTLLQKALASTAAANTQIAAQASTPRPLEPAPGLVRLAGGRTAIGTDVATARKWISEGGSVDIAAETPRHELNVAPFELMVSEVTNEQYEVYVRATGRRPPLHWAGEALLAAQAAHVEAQVRRRAETATTGPNFAPIAFQPESWWNEHWRDARWQVEPENAALPVVEVDWTDAVTYAHWAGLRLMTEAEFQHAGHAASRTNYPWGEAFDRRHASTWDRGVAQASPVGSFPSGATREGVLDLCGNVAEWTHSEWSPYPGFHPLSVELAVGGAKQTKQLEPSWDIGWHTAVGGAFDSRRVDARLASRSGYAVEERRANLGFRCARAAEPGLDRIAWWNARVLGPEAKRALPRLDPRAGLCAERFASRVPLARPPGYAVIERYDTIQVTPIEAVDAGSKKALEGLAQAADGTLLVGVFESTFGLRAPALGAQTCLLAWRPRPPVGAVERGPFGRTIPPSSGSEELLFLDRNGDYLARLTDVSFEFERTPDAGPARVLPAVATGAAAAPSTNLRIAFPLAIRSTVEGRSFVLSTEFEVEAGAVAGNWTGLQL
jgi:iron(II)-dependent oxidoreductase